MRSTEPSRIFLSPPHMGGGELGFVQEAFASNYLAPLGPMVDAFEREFSEYTGIAHCAALSSGTAAIHLALRQLGVGPGDTVAASTLTFLGGVAPILYQGATPVFVDCDRSSWNMDPVLLEQELERSARQGTLPKAVIPTDLYGHCADYDRLKAACDLYGVPLVSDAAEAMGARYKGRHAGAGAACAAFSFNGNKIITSSGGGMLASDDKELVDRVRMLSQQARDPQPHYEHTTYGYNYRMSNVVAAIGRGQLRCLDERVRRRREIFAFYRETLSGLPGIELMPEAADVRSNRWLTVVLITPERFGTDRESVRLALERKNIESRPVWKPMHLQPVFDCDGPCAGEPDLAGLRNALTGKRIGARAVGGAVSEDLFARGLCLPSGTAMTEDDLRRVAEAIVSCRGTARPFRERRIGRTPIDPARERRRERRA